MRKKIFRSIFSTALAAVLVAGTLIFTVLYGLFDERLWEDLRTEARYIARAIQLSENPAGYLAQATVGNERVTWVAADGAVLYDSSADRAGMENHAGREEIVEALATGYGESRRLSATLSQEMLYVALRLEDGTVLRVSDTEHSIIGLLWNMLTTFVLIAIGIALLSAYFAGRMARQITQPINRLDLERPLQNESYDELSPLLVRMQHQNQRIQEQMDALTRQKRDFEAVTEYMREGLVLLDAGGDILSVNHSASLIFSARREECTGKPILALNRSAALQEAVELAQQGKSAQTLLHWQGRCYQIFANPVYDAKGGRGGIVMFLLDVTERQNAERMRREFTANVSHELKTPLTSISGYAEIMQSGVAREEDMRAFAGRIHEESTRMIALINDIMELSRLDERAAVIERELVDLLALARTVCARLADIAAARGVTLRAEGREAWVSGLRPVLEEMLYNLCDNAIKYNREGGRVTVRVAPGAQWQEVQVEDTGIGIPRDEQEKVFERFYRVDKSRSKESGGTGLGLSIVKHGAMLHEAKLDLDSTPGEGTRVRLRFPVRQ